MKKYLPAITSILLLSSMLLLETSIPAQAEGSTATAEINESYRKIWREKGVKPSPLSSDEEFLRRIFLDLTGRIATENQTRAFLESTNPEKRAKLVNQLLEGEEFAEYQASQWTNQFLGHNRDRLVNREEFQSWLETELQNNARWDQIARKMISAEGSLRDNPPLNWYIRHRLDPANLADDTARFFLGIQLGCARCHNHPHDQWTSADFYGLAAFYSGLQRDRLTSAERRKFQQMKAEKEELIEEFNQNRSGADDKRKAYYRKKYMEGMGDLRGMLRLEQKDTTTLSAEIKGETKIFPAKFLLSPEPAHVSYDKRKQLADWITAEENPFFAKAFVNRAWGALLGRGFVDPVDDMSAINDISNPELLHFLANDFAKHKFDIRYLYRIITNSLPYQLSSRTGSKEKTQHHERGKIERLKADQLLNSLLVATSIDKTLRMRNKEDFETKRQLIYRYHIFLFENDENKASEEPEVTIPQVLFMMNSKMINEAIRPHFANATSRLLSGYSDPGGRIEALFRTCLNRNPSKTERDQLISYTVEHRQAASAYEDIFWALLNSNEFLFNH